MIARAVVLAAGSAQRLRPLTDARPKCLLPVGERTIISRAVAVLAAHGIRAITVVDGFEGDQLRAALTAEFPAAWFDFVRNPDFATTNNAWSLLLARRAEPESLLLLDGDVLFDAAVIGRLLASKKGNRIALRTVGPVGEEDVKVTLSSDGRISDIGKHIEVKRAAGESVGIAIFEPTFVRRMFSVLERRLRQEGHVNEWYEAAFVELIQGGESLYPVDLGTLRTIEVDTKEDLEEARRLFGAERLRDPSTLF